ncbi:MAG: DinB family protein [Bacteroidota bacterium]
MKQTEKHLPNASVALAARFKELVSGKWIAQTNYSELLSDLNWQQATKKIGSLNTIAALTYHVNYYIAGLVKVFQGGPLDIKDKYSFDLPDINSEEEWRSLAEKLIQNANTFVELVEAMSDDKLQSPFIQEQYGDYRRNIEGIIEHSYYHMGQLVLLKKMILASEE